MSDDKSRTGNSAEVNWDTSSHDDFYQYYERQSLTPQTLERFRSVRDLILRLYGVSPLLRQLDVLDVGCGAGTQSKFWVERGHRYWGLDINEPLILLARRRAAENMLPTHFDVGTATCLPYGDSSIDICLLPELLEHVANWEGCITEAIRVLRPGGMLYINTNSKLCPKQQEFNLPLYSWYPGPVKRYFEKRAVGDRPDLVNFAKYPAVNWFSSYGLIEYLKIKSFDCMDRFDMIDTSEKGKLARLAIQAVRSLPPLRLLGHVLTPYTVVVARKK